MIVCHCNVITREEIVAEIEAMLAVDEWQLIVPLKVYHALERRGRCCGCFPQVTSIIVETSEKWHQARATPQAEIICFIAQLKDVHRQQEIVRLEAQRRNLGMKAA
ncbi:MAG: (2Fe-2S)-binding protein [Rhizobiaceae bacterium]|jgi:NAD(P)H-nitrite reductase large subunit|nr:(2Fe-2S)-binding protein [Rhizobiaceae bacterium]